MMKRVFALILSLMFLWGLCLSEGSQPPAMPEGDFGPSGDGPGGAEAPDGFGPSDGGPGGAEAPEGFGPSDGGPLGFPGGTTPSGT